MVKQVIVIRKDLKMRRGKEIAQGAHASLLAIMPVIQQQEMMHDETFRRCASQFDTTPYNHWINGDYTKIVVTVNSEQELLDIHNKAIEKRLLCSLVQDKGYTEFNNIPTYTCVAIGPDYSEKIDEITKDLKLY